MLCGIQRIDQLLSAEGSGAPAISPGNADRESLGAIQDLLRGQGASNLPNLVSPDYGVFGPRTTAALATFCGQQGLPQSGEVDATTLRRLVDAPAVAPVACQCYLTLVLDLPYTELAKILSIVAQMEGAGKFAALNLNTDGAGLSFGLIQWAQRPGRLSEILTAFSQADGDQFTQIFGAGDAQLAQALIAHTRRSNGGVDPNTGETLDPAFDLVQEPWVGRFRAAAALRTFQAAQVQTALAAFSKSLDAFHQSAPALQSERGVAFMLDLANQFGDGGATAIYRAVQHDGMTESELLAAMAKESIRRIQAGFQRGTQIRRQNFLTTTLLSDDPFKAADSKLPNT